MTTLTHIGNKLTFPNLKLITPAFSSKFFKILKKQVWFCMSDPFIPTPFYINESIAFGCQIISKKSLH